MSEVERWAVVHGHDGYEVSTSGRVRSRDRVITLSDGRRRPLRGQPMRLRPARKGYQRVSLNTKWRPVHHVVLETFIGPRPDGMVCRHRNGNPSDNRLSNLRWGTPSENEQDKVRHGTHQQASKTTCPLGHELIQPNLTPGSVRAGFRECQACALARSRVSDHASRGRHLDFRQLADEVYEQLMEKAA